MNPSAELKTELKTDHWQDLCRTEKVKKIINDGYLADCKFVVGKENEATETILGHKIFFSMESPVFAKMFEANCKDSQNNLEIRLTDARPHDFKNLSYMIYHNCAYNLSKFSMKELINLYKLCENYQVSSILQYCTNHIKTSKYLNTITLTDLITLVGFANDLTDKSLLQCCINYMKNPNYLKTLFPEDLVTLFECSRNLKDKSLLQAIRPIMQSRIKTLLSTPNLLTAEAFYDYVQTLSASRSYRRSSSSSDESSKLVHDDDFNKQTFLFSIINSYFENNNLLPVLNKSEEKDPDLKVEARIETKTEVESSKKSDLAFKEKIRNLLEKLFKLIIWNHMDFSDFQNGPGLSKLLSYKEKYNIILKIINRGYCNKNCDKCYDFYY